MTNWVKAIQAARANVKEKTKSKLPSVKNMYWHFKMLTELVLKLIIYKPHH